MPTCSSARTESGEAGVRAARHLPDPVSPDGVESVRELCSEGRRPGKMTGLVPQQAVLPLLSNQPF